MTKPLGPYTPAVRAGDWIVVSGQLGQRDGKLVDGLGAQTTQVIANLTTLLAEHGAALTDVAKTLCFLIDFSNDVFAEFNAAYVEGFAGHRPARSTIGVAALPGGARVEIEAWAYKPPV